MLRGVRGRGCALAWSVSSLALLGALGWALSHLHGYADDPAGLVASMLPTWFPRVANDNATTMLASLFADYDWATWAAVGVGVVSAMVAMLLGVRRRPGRWIGGVLLVVLVGDLFVQSLGQVMHSDRYTPLLETPARARWLQERLGEQRYVVILDRSRRVPERQVGRNRGCQHRIRSMAGIRAGLFGAPDRDTYRRLSRSEPRLLSAAGVRYVLVQKPSIRSDLTFVYDDEDITFYENPNCLPMVYFVRRLEQASNAAEVRRQLLMESFPLAEAAVVYRKPPPETADSQATQSIVGHYETTPGRWRIEVETDAAAQLVVLEGYDAGWRADVDGAGVEVFQTNDRFLSVAVPAGAHVVTFEYAPPEFAIGAAMTGLSTPLVAGLWFVCARRVRRRREAREAGS